jgi:hypothetical protein
MGRQLGWVWFGGKINKIYCIPFSNTLFSASGNQFGIIRTESDTLTITSLGIDPQAKYSWTNVAVVGTKIYCIPRLNEGNNQFGIIDTTTDSLTLTSLGVDPSANYSWGSTAVVGTRIYCIPFDNGAANQFGIIDTTTDSLTLTSLGANPGINYRWGSTAVVGTTIYCIPSDRALITQTLISVGSQFGIIDTVAGNLVVTSLNLSPDIDYAWTGTAVNNKVYCVPGRRSLSLDPQHHFGIIDTTTNNLTLTALGTDPSVSSYSWSTIVVVDNKIYCIPFVNTGFNQFGIIDTTTDSLALTSLGANSQLNYAWGAASAVGPKIYCVPRFNTSANPAGNQFGIIDTTINALTLTTLGADPATNYHWASSAAMVPTP